MREQNLGGVWQYRVGRGEWTERTVPYSALPVGHSECRRHFDAEPSPRTFLRFEGITYRALVYVNGFLKGELLPYCAYTLEITDVVERKNNELLVLLEDLAPAFGPSAGWENYGGIIRDVYLQYGDEHLVEDVFFETKLNPDTNTAVYRVSVQTDVPAECRVTLFLEGRVVDSYTSPTWEVHPRVVDDISLWSPDSPTLYTLQVELLHGGRVTDTVRRQVGFRSFTCDDRRFYLNGRPIFLTGVCRHEMVGDYGHTVPMDEIERDLRMIKAAGCNFVRLVHYPHDRRVVEAADRIGLLISEEPGLWWSDTSVPEIRRDSLEVLRRTVRRDRNSPSVAFWLCFNECEFTEEYLREAARICREEDPTRLVSGANCMNEEDTKKYYDLCGFDFYTTHPYGATTDYGEWHARLFLGKPLMFTEWGGYYVQHTPHLLSEFIHTFYGLYRNASEESALAGACFWYWAEVNDFHRPGLACVNGCLKEALVDKDRNPTAAYAPFVEAWRDARAGRGNAGYYTGYEKLYEYRGEELPGKRPFTCESKGDFLAYREASRANVPVAYKRQRGRRVILGPVLQREEISGLYPTPCVLFDGGELVFEGIAATDTVTLIGCVGDAGCYPIGGEYGEAAARVIVCCSDGGCKEFLLRNGEDITTAFASLGSSRIDPRAVYATRFAAFSYEKNVENFVINRRDLPLGEEKTVTSVELESLSRGYTLLFYGVYA